MLEKTLYREGYLREAAALAAAARQGLQAPIPSCPGWTMATLVSHMIEMNVNRLGLVRQRPASFPMDAFETWGLPGRLKEWFMGERSDPRSAPAGLVDLYEETTAELGAALWALEAAEPVSSWWTADQTAGFWQRRMAHETAVHRWDAQLAHGVPAAPEAELASDGIDENFEVMLPSRRRWADHPRQGVGETYHFHRTDGPGEWLLRFAPEGPVVTREHAKGDVAVRGAAADLFLFLWRRIPGDQLEIFGDAALLPRYFELAPPD
ncbi:MAG TPA: maleylpyruvate isomerase family mycothiol-dependent enzyme [Chloroflexota bacterium]|nr:maleylpyruvate isomerase family mycothiol-dependent enzyme [Chloroflexota bacterium]